MTKSTDVPALATLKRAWARLRLRAAELRARALPGSRSEPTICHGLALLRAPPYRRLRVLSATVATTITLGLLTSAALWWRLGSGPLSIDVLTPWLTSALEQRFGGRHRIEVGGTQIERDEDGRAAVRLRDITVRDARGTVVASAPKAEVGIAGIDLSGDLRPERLSLLGAEMAVRIEANGDFNVFAAPARDRDITGTVGQSSPRTLGSVETAAPAPALAGTGPDLLTTLVNWVQSLDAVGLDGRDLVEIGLKNGTISVDDRRTDRQLTFEKINLSLTRVKDGGAAFALSSVGSDGPWSINATVKPSPEGVRVVQATVRDVSPKDLFLALRVDTGNLQVDVPVSAEIRAEVGPDGVVQGSEGRILVGAGYVGDAGDPQGRMLIDEAQVHLRWDPAKRLMTAPIEVNAGKSRVAVIGLLAPPPQPGGAWSFGIPQGSIQLAQSDHGGEPPLVLDRLNLRAVYDPTQRLMRLEQGDLRGPTAAVALTGALDLAGPDPVLTLGATGSRMSTSTFKRLWPAFVTPELRTWIEENVSAGQLERVNISLKAPLPTLKASGPPMPDGALLVELAGRNASIRPVAGLPVVREADLTATITGKAASVSFPRGSVETSPGRKLNLSGGSFEVPSLSVPGLPARAKFRIDGTVEAAAELLAMGPLRDSASVPFEAGSAHGQMAGQFSFGLPLKAEGGTRDVRYAAEADLSGFSAERLIRGQKAEAGQLHVSATERGVLIKGDLKLAGAPASLEFRKSNSEPEAEVRLGATLDDAARTRLGFELGAALTGPVPVKVTGRMKAGAEREGRFAIEADLTAAKITEPFPGWNKAAGRPARGSLTAVDKGQGGPTRLEDIVVEGSGTSLKGSAELGNEGELLRASFPVFALSDGDKASLKVERSSEGTLKIAVRGDLFDGRAFVKTAVAGRKPDRNRQVSQDLDLDIKVGALTGHHGEALRSVDLRASRRGGKIRAFTLAGRVGREGKVAGELRGRTNGRDLINIEASDAGALLRFTDTYPRVSGGALSMFMDPPLTDQSAQEGSLNVRDFTVRDEPGLDRVVSTNVSGDGSERSASRGGSVAGTGVSFSRLKLEFTRSPGRLAIRDGVVWGAAIGATMDGALDYARDEVRLRGTFVPAYALNNMFGRLPIVGMLLGGSNEGLLGITYQVIGSPQSPVLQVNPISAVAPGFLRKLFEFRGADEQTASPASGEQSNLRPPADVRSPLTVR